MQKRALLSAVVAATAMSFVGFAQAGVLVFIFVNENNGHFLGNLYDFYFQVYMFISGIFPSIWLKKFSGVLQNYRCNTLSLISCVLP